MFIPIINQAGVYFYTDCQQKPNVTLLSAMFDTGSAINLIQHAAIPYSNFSDVLFPTDYRGVNGFKIKTFGKIFVKLVFQNIEEEI